MISVINVVKDREDILKVSLPSWLNYSDIDEIVIVDWGSEKNIRWILELDSRIKLIEVTNVTGFNLARAYNLALDHTANEIILKLDVDYVLNPTINFFESHPISPDVFYTGNAWGETLDFLRHLNGMVYVYKMHLDLINGYDESFDGYGYDDDDLYNRLKGIGLQRYIINKDFSIFHIPHSDEIRFKHWDYKLHENRLVSDSRHKIVRQCQWKISPENSGLIVAELIKY